MRDDDLPPDPDDEDPDRAAILARRKRFIAIALSGLASGASCAAQPCLKVIAPQDPDEQRPARPEACLSVAPDPEPPQPEPAPDAVTPPPEPSPEPTPPRYSPPSKPEACLKIAGPRD